MCQDVISAVVVDKHSEISYREVPTGGLSIKTKNMKKAALVRGHLDYAHPEFLGML